MPPTEPNDEERTEQVNSDEQAPFQPAAPNPDTTSNTVDPAAGSQALADDHPATDTNIDPQELYDEGVSGAAEVNDQSADSAVTSFTPPSDPDGSQSSDTDSTPD